MSTPSAKLQKEWYKKLKESGFKDIEKKNGSIGRTQLNLSNRNFDQIQATQEYYSMARTFILEHVFKDNLEKYIWTKHSEGDSERTIVKCMQEDKLETIPSRATVGRIIKKLVKLMKAKYLVS